MTISPISIASDGYLSAGTSIPLAIASSGYLAGDTLIVVPPTVTGGGGGVLSRRQWEEVTPPRMPTIAEEDAEILAVLSAFLNMTTAGRRFP